MKLAAFVFVVTTAALAAANGAERTANGNLMLRDLRSETSDELSISGTIQAGLRDDDLGSSEEFWDNWENHFDDPRPHSDPCSGDSSYASNDGGHEVTVGGVPAAAKDLLEKAASVATAALPFDFEHAKSLLLPVGLVVAALFVIAIAAVLVGVRRQQLSEPMFGPVELASDLPDPMTTSAASASGSASASDDEGKCNEEDTGVTILVNEEEEEKEEESDDRSSA